MKKILYKLSLRYHYPMRSDNLNNVMKLNRFLANPLIIALKIILMDAGIFFLLNFIVNVLKNLRNLYGLKFDMYQLVTEHHFREEGFIKVRLAYMKGNPQSKRFWQKCGFTEIGIERDNEHGKAVVLEKAL